MAAPPRTNASPHWTARPALAQWEGGMLPGGAEPRARGSGSSPGEVESGETGARLPQRPPQDWRSGAVVSARGPSRGTAWSRPGSCDHDAAAGSEALETQAWGRQGPADTPQPNKGRGGQKRRSAAKKFVRWASMSVRWTPKAARSPVVGWGAARKPCRATRLLRGRAGTLGPFQISAAAVTVAGRETHRRKLFSRTKAEPSPSGPLSCPVLPGASGWLGPARPHPTLPPSTATSLSRPAGPCPLMSWLSPGPDGFTLRIPGSSVAPPRRASAGSVTEAFREGFSFWAELTHHFPQRSLLSGRFPGPCPSRPDGSDEVSMCTLQPFVGTCSGFVPT
ncbi:uncharacterized protein [Callorhinus ursinus]|uniref:uncharacterized protein isoform X1 n=1 Tax=Callorhinus ursinus TaxID=34884 RepID=UPI003CD01E71